VREGVPEKGDLRYPTRVGTIFVGVFRGWSSADPWHGGKESWRNASQRPDRLFGCDPPR
jgi:hypothetical protein